MDTWGDYEKLHTALKYYMIGKGYHLGLKAMYFAQRYHTGVRKDGKTREFMHQIEIAMSITTLKGLENEEIAVAAALLHDVMEDYEIPRSVLELEFNAELVAVVWLLTKEYKGVKKDTYRYFLDISNNATASVVKGMDRVHNVQTMVGVFSIEKQKSYIKEVKELFLPMLKKARYLFAIQGFAYANIEHTLRSQIYLIEAIHSSLDSSSAENQQPE